jgi:hypothetical protein
LRQAGIPIPELKWSCHLPDSHWLILEEIPHPLPVAGLGGGDTYRQLAARYLDAWGQAGEALPWSVDTLARDIALAKVAAVTMLLRAHADMVARVPGDAITWLVEHVPSWVQSLR